METTERPTRCSAALVLHHLGHQLGLLAWLPLRVLLASLGLRSWELQEAVHSVGR